MKGLLYILCLGIGLMLGYSGPPGEPAVEKIHQLAASYMDQDVSMGEQWEYAFQMNGIDSHAESPGDLVEAVKMPMINERAFSWRPVDLGIQDDDVGKNKESAITKNYKFLLDCRSTYSLRC